MPEPPQSYKVENEYGAPHYLTAPEANILFTDLCASRRAELVGDCESGFEYTSRQRFNGVRIGRVRVTPLGADDAPENTAEFVARHTNTP